MEHALAQAIRSIFDAFAYYLAARYVSEWWWKRRVAKRARELEEEMIHQAEVRLGGMSYAEGAMGPRQ